MIRDFFLKFKYHINSIGWYLGSSLLAAFIGIALNPLMAKNLSAEDYAIIGYYTSFNLLLLPLMHLNLMSYFMKKFFTLSKDDRERMSNVIVISLIPIGLLVLFVFSTLFYFYCKKTNVAFAFFPYAILTFLQVYTGLFVTFYLTKLRINRKSKMYGFITILSSLLAAFFSVIFVVIYKNGADGRLWSLLISSLLLALFSFKMSLTKWEFDWLILKEALIFGYPLTISAILWYFISGIDRAILVGLNDSYTFGIYSIAIQMSGYLLIIYTSLSTAFEPDIFQAVAEKRLKKMMLILCTIMGVVIFVNVLFIIFAPFLISFLTAGRYIAATSFAQILSLQNITMSAYYLIVKVHIAHGYVKTELFVRIFGAILTILLFRFLIDKFSFYGAAWGQVFSFLILFVISTLAFLIVHKFGLNTRRS